MKLLETIHSPADLRPLTLEQLDGLAQELRDYITACVSKTGGHLASSLGAVELTLALHRVLNTPADQLVWDVGHQAYAHKILTGRREAFATLRQYGGLAGFPKREESPYDTFNTGHSSTSISAALGMARARDLAGEKHKVAAVIGDGSLSNGMALEALNDAGHKKTDLLVILNDNRMSISAPVGGLSNYLNQIITGSGYNTLKSRVENLLSSIPKFGKSAVKATNVLEALAKGLIVPGVFFEELGLRYFGPVDGHDLTQLVPMLERVSQLGGPRVLHVLTTKGKGVSYAEENPEGFHGTPRFDPATGARPECRDLSYSQVFSSSLLHEAQRDPKVVAIVAAMTSGTALDEFAQELPERFFDVGIAESHAVTLAAGLASRGFKPVVAVYSTFLQRAYDQIVHDVCLQNLPVIFALDRAGLVGEDGPTHHGVFDIAYLRHIPNLTLLAPADADELIGAIKAALAHPGPVAIRYPRGTAACQELDLEAPAIHIGRGRIVRQGRDVVLLAAGHMVRPALAAAERLEHSGLSAAVLDPRSLKPLDGELLTRWQSVPIWFTLEDHVLAGGFGSAVLEWLSGRPGPAVEIERIGLPDAFIEHGSMAILHQKYGLTAEAIADRVLARMRRKPGTAAPDKRTGRAAGRRAAKAAAPAAKKGRAAVKV